MARAEVVRLVRSTAFTDATGRHVLTRGENLLNPTKQIHEDFISIDFVKHFVPPTRIEIVVDIVNIRCAVTL